MNLLTDLEIIRSALLSGEIDDAVSRVDNRVKRYQSLYFLTKNMKYSVASDILSTILEVLKGKAPPDSVIKISDEVGDSMYTQFNIADSKEYFKNLVYYLQLMLDRYNIKYPVYDAKRCGDL